MSFLIAEHDSPTVARLKLLYLGPIYLVTVLPLSFWIGLRQYGWMATKCLWQVIRHGRP